MSSRPFAMAFQRGLSWNSTRPIVGRVIINQSLYCGDRSMRVLWQSLILVCVGSLFSSVAWGQACTTCTRIDTWNQTVLTYAEAEDSFTPVFDNDSSSDPVLAECDSSATAGPFTAISQVAANCGCAQNASTSTPTVDVCDTEDDSGADYFGGWARSQGGGAAAATFSVNAAPDPNRPLELIENIYLLVTGGSMNNGQINGQVAASVAGSSITATVDNNGVSYFGTLADWRNGNQDVLGFSPGGINQLFVGREQVVANDQFTISASTQSTAGAMAFDGALAYWNLNPSAWCFVQYAE